MGAVGFLRLQPELLLSIQFNPETVDVGYVSKSLMKESPVLTGRFGLG